MSNLEEHARRELELAGFTSKDSYYGGDLADAVLDLIRVFASQGHSGASASATLLLFLRLARFKRLNPPSADPSEWMEVGEGVWQNLRDPNVFSADGGKTYYDIDEEGRPVRESTKKES